jgi:hypothetical protein
MDEAVHLATEFLRIADERGSRADEASLRTAVGRAYYAVVLLAALVTATPRDRSFHSNLRRDLERLSYRSLASRMGQMHHLRNVADYQSAPESHRDGDWPLNWRQVRRDVDIVFPQLFRMLEQGSSSS